MSQMKKNVLNRVLSSTVALTGVILIGSAAAQGIPKEGRYDFSSCWSGLNNIIAFSKTHSAFSYEMTGTTRSNPSGGMFDKSTFRCVGVNYSFEGKVAGTAVCEAVDQDGDKTLTHYAIEGLKATRLQIAGTGKYEGMVSSGTTEPLGPFPAIKPGTFQNCNRQTGTYKMK